MAVMPSDTSTPDAFGQPDLVVPYKHIDDVTLTLRIFLPERSDGPPLQGVSRPVILWFHGGGWQSGSPSQFYPQCAYFAERGVLCIAAEYRLGRLHGTTPMDAVRDAFDAMRFVRRHATGWGGDATRIGAAGGSAGGHLAASLATLTAPDLAGSAEQAASARPALLILFNPVFDNGPVGGYGHDRMADRWQDMSPAHNLNASVPPMLIMLGDKDHLLPVETVRRFTEQLDKWGVSQRTVVYPGAQHGFFNYGREDGRYFLKTRTEVEAFLTERNWLTPVAGHRETQRSS